MIQIKTTGLTLPKVIGHRGACGYAPENTLVSMQKAQGVGASWVEFDVMLTADQHAIIIHDDKLDHTTNGQGWVANANLADIQQLDAGAWFDAKFAGEKVPTFAQLLACAAVLNLGINVEIKPTVGKESETAEQIIEVLTQYWSAPTQLLVSSFSITSLRTARSLAAHINMGLLMHEWLKNWQALADELDCISIHVNHKLLTPTRVADIKASGRYLLAYTINNSQRARQLYAWGVDAVFSDFPDRLINKYG